MQSTEGMLVGGGVRLLLRAPCCGGLRVITRISHQIIERDYYRRVRVPKSSSELKFFVLVCVGGYQKALLEAANGGLLILATVLLCESLLERRCCQSEVFV